jgi:hypothetical protein
MSTQYRLVQSGKTASGSCSAGQGSLEPVAPRIYLFLLLFYLSHYEEVRWGVEVTLNAFFTLALDECEWLTSRRGLMIPGG